MGLRFTIRVQQPSGAWRPVAWFSTPREAVSYGLRVMEAYPDGPFEWAVFNNRNQKLSTRRDHVRGGFVSAANCPFGASN